MDPKVDELVQNLAGSIKGLVVGRTKQYLNDEIAARKEFLEERTKRLAELTVDLAKAPTDDDRAAIRSLMEDVTDAMENELVAAAVDASVAARATFQAVLATVLDFAEKALPIIIKILAAAA
jgi:hypothetical protein